MGRRGSTVSHRLLSSYHGLKTRSTWQDEQSQHGRPSRTMGYSQGDGNGRMEEEEQAELLPD